MHAAVVIPTLNGCSVLAEALASLQSQTVPADVVVVDNASRDGTVEMVRSRFPQAVLVRNTRNEGFGRAVNQGVAKAGNPDVIILVNNDAVCAPDFVERMLAPFADAEVGMVAGVLLQGSAPELVDSAGIELDRTLRSWDLLWNRPVAELDSAASPVGPCGGAAAYRAGPFRDLCGFDEALFAYWEDVDLALRLRLAGWRCASAPHARALHRHGATLGAASAAQRRLEAFGRGYVLAKYRVGARRPLTRLKVAVLDFPVLMIHLLVRRELGPIRERLRGRRAGLARTPLRAPLELASVPFREALRRQASVPVLRLTRRLPGHFAERESPLA